MRRYKLTIKGSESELKWLNHLAKKGWLLKSVRGNWYQFTKTSKTYRLFSEYVTDDVATDLKQPQGPFQVLTTVHLTNPEIWVCYSGTTEPQLQATRVDAGDAELQLKIALAMRAHLLNRMNILFALGLLLVIGLIYFNVFTDDGMEWIVFFWLVISFTPAFMAGKVHRQSNALRVRTGDYRGAWRPTQHVFLNHMSHDLDLDKVKDIGEWTLVGHDQKGMYWYDVRSLASLAEIKKTLQPIVGDSVDISVMSYLGLAPIGYI